MQGQARDLSRRWLGNRHLDGNTKTGESAQRVLPFALAGHELELGLDASAKYGFPQVNLDAGLKVSASFCIVQRAGASHNVIHSADERPEILWPR